MWKCYIKHPVGVMVVRDQNTVFGQKKVKKKKKKVYMHIYSFAMFLWFQVATQARTFKLLCLLQQENYS